MRMPVILSVLMIGLLAPLACSQPAYALLPAKTGGGASGEQVNAPADAGAMSGLQMTVGDVEDLSVDFNEAFESIDNPFLADAMKLNYQISLLEKMTERQAELVKISESFETLGIPFNEPAPSRGICAQLPPNGPCLKYFPELYSDVVSERKAYYDAIKAKQAALFAQMEGAPVDTADPAAVERARKAKAEKDRKIAEAKARAAAKERSERYQWSEVTCLTGSCDGVVIAPRLAGYRATVQAGSRLPDGTLIEEISTRGIRVIIDGDRIDLRPSPTGDAAAASAAAAPNSIDMSDVLANEGAIVPDSAISTADEADAPVPGISISNITPANQGAQANAADDTSAAPAGSSSLAAQAATMNGGGVSSGASVVQPTLGPSGLF